MCECRFRVKEKIMMEGIHTETVGKKLYDDGEEKKCARSREWVAVERWRRTGRRIVVQKLGKSRNFSHKNSPKKLRISGEKMGFLSSTDNICRDIVEREKF